MAFLILTDQENQAAVVAIANQIAQRNLLVKLINLTELADLSSYAFSPWANPSSAFASPRWQQQQFVLDQFALVCGFYRGIWHEADTAEAEDRFLQVEKQANIEAILADLEIRLNAPEYWCNPDSALRIRHQLSRQYQIARQAGFKTAASLIGNDAAMIREFALAHGGRVVSRALSGSRWLQHPQAKASILSAAQCELDPALFYCPALYQEILAVRYSVRVLVVGESMQAFKLAADHGNLQLSAAFPWAIVKPIDLPLPIQLAIQKIRHNCGLDIFSLDFVIDQQQQWYFIAMPADTLNAMHQADPALALIEQLAAYLMQRAVQNRLLKAQLGSGLLQ